MKKTSNTALLIGVGLLAGLLWLRKRNANMFADGHDKESGIIDNQNITNLTDLNLDSDKQKDDGTVEKIDNNLITDPTIITKPHKI